MSTESPNMKKPNNPPNVGPFPRFSIFLIVGCTFIMGAMIAFSVTDGFGKSKHYETEAEALLNRSFDSEVGSHHENFQRGARAKRLSLLRNETTENTVYAEDSYEFSDAIKINNGYQARGYNATLKIYLPGYSNFSKDMDFMVEGKASIKFELDMKSGKPLILNNVGLKINESSVRLSAVPLHAKYNSYPRTLNIERIEYSLEREQVHFYSRREDLARLESIDYLYTLELTFTRKMEAFTRGLYYTFYNTKEGEVKYVASTHMEPVSARNMLPCVDQPDVRDVFTMNIIHPIGTTALTNGREIATKKVDANFLSTTFEPTPSMPSYLLAITVSNFKHLEGRTKNNLRLRVWADADRIKDGEFALSAGIKCFEYFEDLFKIPFPMSKTDMFASNGYGDGAMENYGLILYANKALLAAENDVKTKIYVARTIAHEISHMWFGNRATTSFWHTVWLNEGFANIMETYGMQQVLPEMDRPTTHLRNIVQPGLKADVWATTRPVSLYITTFEEVKESFGIIPYCKGGAIIQMLQSIYGEDLFWKSLRDYLTDRNHKSATPAILADFFQKNTPETLLGANGKTFDAKDYIYQWTNQINFPVLTVSRLNKTTVRIHQNRFKKSEYVHEKDKYAHPHHNFTWDVLVKYRTGVDSGVKSAWLSRERPLDIACESDSPVILNIGGEGFYRQNFNLAEWDKVIKHMQNYSQDYDRKTRYALISDAFEMASVGKMSYEQLFDLLLFTKNTKDSLIQEAVKIGISDLAGYYADASEIKLLNTYADKLLNTSNKASNNASVEKPNYIELSSSVFSSSISPSALSPSKLNTTSVVLGPTPANCPEGSKTSQCVKITESDRLSVYKYYVEHGGQAAFDRMFQFYQRETILKEKKKLLSALTVTKIEANLIALLDTAFNYSSNVILNSDIPSLLSDISENKVATKLFFEYFAQHWDHIIQGVYHGQVTRYLYAFTKHVWTEPQLKVFEKFSKTAKNAEKFGAFAKIIDQKSFEIEWISKYSADVLKQVKTHLNRL